VGKTECQARLVSRVTSSILGGPPEPTPETSEPGLVGARAGWIGGIQPSPSPPAETNGTTGEKQKDEGGKCHPERRRGICGKIRVVQVSNFMLDEREQGDIYRECDEGEEGREERDERRDEGNRNMG